MGLGINVERLPGTSHLFILCGIGKRLLRRDAQGLYKVKVGFAKKLICRDAHMPGHRHG